MGECDLCEGDDDISFSCNECGGTFCSDHRLPEAHRCKVLLEKDSEEWFKEGLSVRKNRQSERIVRGDDSGDENSQGTSERTCVYCDRITEQECEKCGTPYCKRHKSPRVHNCAFLNVDVEDGEENEPDEDGGLLSSLRSTIGL